MGLNKDGSTKRPGESGTFDYDEEMGEILDVNILDKASYSQQTLQMVIVNNQGPMKYNIIGNAHYCNLNKRAA